jgi:uncharacterized protein YjbI with pentapeptide repeats
VSSQALPSMRRPRLIAASLVGGLIAIGTAVSLSAGAGSVGRDLGLAILSGGIVGGALVTVESLLASAADKRSAAASLRMMLSTTTDLNGIDLSGEQLAEMYLPGRALVAAELSNAEFTGTKLPFADLRFAQLRAADLRNVDLRGATLAGADLTGADLRGALLDDADISDAVLAGADLRGATLRDVRAQRTRFGNATVTAAQFDNVFLEGADLSEVAGTLTLQGAAQYDETTRWRPEFDPPDRVAVRQEPISEMDLAMYLAYRQRRDAALRFHAEPREGPQ